MHRIEDAPASSGFPQKFQQDRPQNQAGMGKDKIRSR
jgi:hypothetical protein